MHSCSQYLWLAYPGLFDRRILICCERMHDAESDIEELTPRLVGLASVVGATSTSLYVQHRIIKMYQVSKHLRMCLTGPKKCAHRTHWKLSHLDSIRVANLAESKNE